MKADKLASFRIDSQLWKQFQSYTEENNTNASALLVAYIKSVVNTSNVNTSSEVVNTSSDHLSIHDIDSRIDEKIKASIQDINTPSIQNIEGLIDSRIGGSVQDGDIKDAIATSYAGMMGQFNGLLEELQDLKSQLQELKSVPPVAADNSPAIDSPAIDNSPAELEVPHNKQQIIRAALSKKNIKVSSAQIRKAFVDAGWDGNNFNEIKKDILAILSGDKK